MLASVEWTTERVGLLRVHSTGGQGDEWTFSCVLRPRGTAVELALAPRCPTISEARAIRKAAWAEGYKRIEWERRNTPLDRVTVFKKRAAPAPGVNVEKEMSMAQASESLLAVSIRLKAVGGDGFFHAAEVDYQLTREQFEFLQRGVVAGLMGLQKTAE